MSRQTYFVMAEEDEKRFLEFLNEDRTVRVIFEATPTPKLDILDHFAEMGPWKFSCYLWDATHSPPPVVEFIEKQNYYLLDEKRSEVIEFDRSLGPLSHKDRKIKAGRVFIDTTVYLDGEFIPRPKYFLDWYDKVARWIRKNGVGKYDMAYVYPHAAQLIEEGYKVSFS